jgi:hypothetical protein
VNAAKTNAPIKTASDKVIRASKNLVMPINDQVAFLFLVISLELFAQP